MGENEVCAEPGEPLLNGLLPGANLVMRSLDEERWVRAEERVAELIACIQPNQLSEERRNAVADYVQQLIMKCIPSQVCRFGSVPLKTYLPDGDIDLTAISHNQNPKDTWANQVRDMLESEENNENAEFHVKEVQYIQAEVKIIKCLVENIVVDISFNQVGGLCTLCFLDEVDSLINQNHLFKRSIILIKAWCYYESRILGAHHGLISTYALETLVLYIFHVFNNSFNGPLEVLYRFLAFFSNFDWDNFCVSLWGPVPITSLPDVTAQPPRRDSGELLLSKVFLEACSSVYAVLPGGQENNGQLFFPKHFNVIDPLRVSNNLGRSVSKGNFFRIRSAFAFGAKKLAKLLDCPKENVVYEVNQFFMNTWDRHGSGHRPDAPGIDTQRLRLPTPDKSPEFESSNNNKTDSNRKVEKIDTHSNAKNLSRTAPMTSVFKSQPMVSSQIGRGRTNPVQVIFSDKIQKDLVNDTQGRLLFARTHSSPELTDNYIDVSSQVQRNRRMDSAEATRKSRDFSAESGNMISNSYQRDLGLEGLSDEFSALAGARQMNQEEQDIVNMMPSASLSSQRHQHAPFNLTSGHLPYSIPPSFLASMGYTPRNFPGFVPANVPFMDPSFPRGLVSPQLTRYFPGIGLNNNPSEDSVEMNSVEADVDFWKEQDAGPSGGYVTENGNLDFFQSVDNNPPPSRVNHAREKRGSVSEVCGEEKPARSRLSSASRSQTSSESSWDGTSVSKSTKDKRGSKIGSIDITNSQEKGKIRSEHDTDDDDDQEWGTSAVSEQVSDLQFLNRKQHNMPPQTSGSDSMIPFAPMLINHGLKHVTNDNSGMIAFYPTGPPIPFLTMLPLYNLPSETGTSDGRFGGDETLDNSESGTSFTPKGHDFSRGMSESDILSSDFASHWHNLQFGRFCQNSHQQGSLVYPSPVMVPPVYFQGQIPYDRPLSTNTNLFSQLMTSHGHRMVPVAPVSSRHPNVYHSYTDDVPRFRGGTGTYLPNPVPVRDRHSSSSRRGNYNYDRNDSFGDRESNWSSSPKPRNHRSQSDNKINSRNERFNQGESRWWNSNRRSSSTPSYQAQNNGTGSSQNASHGMYSSNGVSNGTSGLPLVMMYPFDRNGSQSEPLEFGSLGPVGFTDANEQTHHRSSPEQPSSPRHQRRA